MARGVFHRQPQRCLPYCDCGLHGTRETLKLCRSMWADGCADPTIRLRNRDMLLCRHRLHDGYRCEFGFDLSTGLSIGGSVSGALYKP